MEGRGTGQEQGFHDRRAATVGGRVARRATGAAGRLDARKAGLAVFAAIAVLGIVGLAYSDRFGSRLNLDSEGSPPAWYSAALLVSAGMLTLLRGRLGPRTREGLPWLLAGVFFLFMALDELFGVHEELEAVAGVDWQLLYAPLSPSVRSHGWGSCGDSRRRGRLRRCSSRGRWPGWRGRRSKPSSGLGPGSCIQRRSSLRRYWR